jgi:predicted small lipoprotein YifL
MLCWTRYLFILIVIVLGTSSMLSACGQKGPLVMPDETSTTEAGTDNN